MNSMKFRFLAVSMFFLLISMPGFTQEWMTDYDKAMEKAVAENKHVLLFFTGSDWCPPCKRIKQEVYTSEAFKQYAEEKFILLLADFPKRPENKLSPDQESKNKALARVFNPRGFPTSIILDKEGNELKRWVGYDPDGVGSYLENFDRAMNL